MALSIRPSPPAAARDARAAAAVEAEPICAAIEAEAEAEAPAPGWWNERLPATALQQQRAALLLWHFNCRIAGLAHPSWIEHPLLAHHAAGSAQLLARHGLTGCHDWHFEAAAKRLWLIDAASLGALALALGGVAQAPLLRRLLRRERRQALQAAWPPIAWEAAHDPLAPRLDAPWPLDASAAAGEPVTTVDALARLGAQCLRGLLAPGWRAVAGRARLRLPRPWADDAPLVLPHAERRALLNWITAVWVPQRSAAWAWLF
jgi:hypothetical protein